MKRFNRGILCLIAVALLATGYFFYRDHRDKTLANTAAVKIQATLNHLNEKAKTALNTGNITPDQAKSLAETILSEVYPESSNKQEYAYQRMALGRSFSTLSGTPWKEIEPNTNSIKLLQKNKDMLIFGIDLLVDDNKINESFVFQQSAQDLQLIGTDLWSRLVNIETLKSKSGGTLNYEENAQPTIPY